MTLRLTRQFSFEMAHALPAYEGKCRNIHGHSYRLAVTVEGTPVCQAGAPDDGMVIDFARLKQAVTQAVVEPFDHALVLPRVEGVQASDAVLPQEDASFGGYGAKLLVVDFQPTTENLLMHFARLLEGALPEGTRLYSIRLSETEHSSAELFL